MLISKELTDFINETYVLKALTRYNNKFKVIHESVAEHMYFVALIVMQLYQYYDFNLEKALSMAIIHDLPEIFISDITRDVKLRHPELLKILSKAEVEAMAQFSPKWLKLFKEFEGEDTAEADIVRLADAYSVKQYTGTEMTLGNTGYMQEVNDSIRRRLGKLLDKVEIYKRESDE